MPSTKHRENLTILIDNFDSFTWNVYQFLSLSGANVKVYRNDAITLVELDALNPTHIVVSPGPGAGISCAAILHFAGRVPILGVCLGEQAIYQVFGGTVDLAGEIVHGKTSSISHDSQGLYAGINRPFKVTRYHSLACDLSTLPDCLVVTSTCETIDGSGTVIMGVRHKEYAVEGVQFHPESVASEEGLRIVANFLSWNGGTWDTLDQSPVIVSKPVTSRPATNKVGQGLDISQLSLDATTKDTSILNKIKAERLQASLMNQSLPGMSFLHLQRQYALGLAPSGLSLVEKLRDALGLAVFAEIKRASPSKGDISIHACAASTARVYADVGVQVISVLTEEKYFKGSLRDLSAVRTLFGNMQRPCVLRKDFIVDRYMVLESRLHGADCILLIVAMLNTSVLRDLIVYTRELGMEPLVEVVDEKEMQTACDVGALVVGINNRNLHSFEVDMTKTGRVAKGAGKGVKIIALSGVKSKTDVDSFGGVDGVLVGEALMRAVDPGAFIRELKGLPEVVKKQSKKMFVKICGITSAVDALQAVDSGADMIGLIFASASKRRVTTSSATEIVSALHAKYPRSGSQVCYIAPFDDGTNNEPTEWFAKTKQLLESMIHKSRPLVVGVFTSEFTPADINSIALTVGLDLIQLHGNSESDLNIARYCNRPVIKAFHMGTDDTPSLLRKSVGAVSMALLDSSGGGTGTTWDWEENVGDSVPFILAGGLTPENVGEGVKKVRPWGVDVAGGVEVEKGIKDHAKVTAFIRAVNQ